MPSTTARSSRAKARVSGWSMVCWLRWKKPCGLCSEGTARNENGLSQNDASLKMALKMSSRSPSTPSSSQWRTTSSICAFTAGLR